jgi:hypothetical protein
MPVGRRTAVPTGYSLPKSKDVTCLWVATLLPFSVF